MSSGTVVDARRALRSLGRAPGFAVGVTLVLGIAVAGAVTVGTAAYELFLRPLPYSAPGQLVMPRLPARAMGFEFGPPPLMISEIRAMPMVQAAESYDALPSQPGADGKEWARAGMTPGLARMLGVQPVIGRHFGESDEPGGLPVALVSERVWRNRFGADRNLPGRQVRLGDRTVTVVGVLPASFTLPSAGIDIWEPIHFKPDDMAAGNFESFSDDRVIARLEPGVTAAQFEAAWRAGYANDERLATSREIMGLEFQVETLREAWTANQRKPLAIIGLASLLVLAVAILNIAGLWLARLIGQSHEHAIQTALGAGPWRALGRTLVEFLLLGTAGGIIALTVTPWALSWLKSLKILPTTQPLVVDTGTATFFVTLILLLVCAIPVLGAAWWQIRRQRKIVADSLARGGRGHAGSGARARRVLLIAQVALAMSLLSATALLLRSWHGLLTEDLGFDARRLLVSQVNPVEQTPGLTPSDEDPRIRAALERVRGLPGVAAVSHTNVPPFSRSEGVASIPIPGQPDGNTSVRSRNVGPDFFRATGIRILQGRPFAPADADRNVAVVDELLASRYFPQGAVGQSLRDPVDGDYREMEIIGVVRTAKHRSPGETPDRGTVYRFRSEPYPATAVVIAADIDPATLVEPAKEVLDSVLGADRVGPVLTMESMVRRTVRDREPQLLLLSIFAGQTLALAGVGIFSLLAYSVRARTAEFGVRQAVGARPGHIRRHVLGDAVRLLLPGLALGIAGACVGGYLVADRLHEVAPADPLTWLAAGSVLAMVVVAASLLPANRAARIQPTEALRHE